MRKKVFLFNLLVFLCSFGIFAKELTVMSFNVQGHGPGSSEHDFGNAKWKNQIAAVIKQSGASIVLLQEVRLNSENDINPLIEILNGKGGKWKSTTSVKYATCSYDLNNAVLYDEKNVLLVNDLSKKLNFRAYKYDQDNNVADDCRTYQFDKNNEQVLEFSFPKNSAQTFYVVNVHAPGPGSQELRKEKEQLENLYRHYKRKPIIIAGDFNMRRREFVPSSAFGDAIVDGDSGMYADANSLRTTLSTAGMKISLANDYDHFIVSRNSLFNVSEQMHHVFSPRKKESYDSIKIGGTTYKSTEEYKQGVSDHLPIMMKLNFSANK